MKTNFFEQVAGLQINGNLQINIQANDIGTVAVSVLLSNANPKITQGKNILPNRGFFLNLKEFKTQPLKVA